MDSVNVCKNVCAQALQEANEKNKMNFLLASHGNVEVMLQTFYQHSVAMLSPAEFPDTFEFCYVLSGTLEIENEQGEKIICKQGDSFSIAGLTRSLPMRSLEVSQLLYVTNTSVYNELSDYNDYLNELLLQVDQKDKYTYGHGKRVMDYCMEISRAMSLPEIDIQNLAFASLFHDVGKCFVADEILKKTAPLSREEFREVMKHPVHSRRLLEKNFGPDVCEIAAMHHERLDGSGYPYGLSGKQIRKEARIIAVADALDAMTSLRSYNKPVTVLDAATELHGMPDKFDKSVVSALLKLIKSGKWSTEQKKESE